MKFLFILGVVFSQISLSAQQLKRADLHLQPPIVKHCTPVKDQSMSSTCWSFSSTSFLESELLKKGKGATDLSEMFIARHSMMRKIERHLNLNGSNFFTPGGQFHDAVWVMKNYGAMPEEAYTGKGRGEKDHDHAEMDTVFNGWVKYILSLGITELNTGQRRIMDSMFDYYYGKIPALFVYKGKTYTPKTYLKNYLGINPDDYVEITSYTHHPFYTKFVLEDKYNWTADEYWNVPIKDFEDITKIALDNGYTVGWDGDAADEYFDYTEGIAYMPSPIKDMQAARQTAFEDKTTELNHMMHIVARTKEMGDVWYYIKNSWGNTNSLGGYLWMREDYFKMRTLAIIVNKNAIPFGTRQKMGL